MKRFMALALLLLPTLILAGWALWIPIQRADHPELRIRLVGYDPRDLLQGHYLLARLDIARLSPDDPTTPSSICLVPRPEHPGIPGYTKMVDGTPCPYPLTNPSRWLHLFQPKATALRLEALLRDGKSVVDIGVRFDGTGEISLHDIHVDGRPLYP